MTGDELRDLGIARSDASSSDRFKQLAAIAVYDIAWENKFFTSDDIWVLLPPTPERRALGAIMVRAIKAHVCRATGRYVRSTRPEAHRNPKAEYESLVYHREPRWAPTPK